MTTYWLIQRANLMFRGMMGFTEQDKNTLYEFFAFLKSKAESAPGESSEDAE